MFKSCSKKRTLNTYLSTVRSKTFPQSGIHEDEEQTFVVTHRTTWIQSKAKSGQLLALR